MTWINVGKSLIYSTQKIDMIFLHEALTANKMVKQWRNKWGGRAIFSHADSASWGVCIPITRNLNIKIHKQIRDTYGRYIILNTTINDVNYTIENVYAPSDDDPELFVNFWQQIEQFENDFKIVGGDWNLVLDIDIGK